MKKSLENQPQCPRRRFDYVIGNPPYISYNECAKQKVLIFELMKQRKAKLSDIYGVNLHSVPGNPKRYRPNPNLYAFFVSLGLALLKDGGKLSYIVPQTFLINPDYDVLRYHLVKYVTIEKIIIFSGQMFIGRGLRQNKPIATSSLVFVVRREAPSPSNEIEVTYYKKSEDDIEVCLKNILKKKNLNVNRVKQQDLLVSVNNWNFIKYGKQFQEFYKEYKKRNEDIAIYYDHILAKQYFKSKFYFDGGYQFDERLANLSKKGKDDYEVLDFPDKGYLIKGNKGFWPNQRDKKDKYFIKLRQANQGYSLVDSTYKVIWPYLRDIRFAFSDKPVIWSRRTTNTFYGIGSENKEELFYLLALLNSLITQKIINSFRLDNESKRGILVSTSLLKKEIRVPSINQNNLHIKKRIIQATAELIELERNNLCNLVDFSGVLKQRFDKVQVSGNKLVLEKDGEKIELQIKKDPSLVSKVIEENFGQDGLGLENKTITLSELTSLPVIDFEKQKALKDLIDDLVFCLYFNIDVPKNKVKNAKFVKNLCQKNKFYRQVNEKD